MEGSTFTYPVHQNGKDVLKSTIPGMLASPYPWFGGKRKIAAEVWASFGHVNNYVEPFFGSGAVLLARPDFDADDPPLETINDADGFVANFWRALKADPEAVTWWADYPVNETDLHARHGWLINRRERLTWSLEDPDFYDAKIAGWWVWGVCQWIGSGWCSGEGPWQSNGAHTHLGNAGRGINRQLPHLGDAGRGMPLGGYLHALAERMRKVRVTCGDWSRIMGDTPTVNHGMTAVFLDPPYSDAADREENLYAVDCGKVAHEVREWCIANGDNSELRIVLCGYEGEHDMPAAWRCEMGQIGQGAGYGNQGNGRGRLNSKRERLWFSPACLVRQRDLLAGIDQAANF